MRCGMRSPFRTRVRFFTNADGVAGLVGRPGASGVNSVVTSVTMS
jgi:hypothetical protein